MHVHTCIIHLKSRCAETDSEHFLLDLCFALCTFLLSEREGGREVSGVALLVLS